MKTEHLSIIVAITFFWLITSLLLTLNMKEEYQVANATIKLIPSKQQVKVGEVFSVGVEINPTPANAKIAGWQMNLNFDPSVIAVHTVTEGDFLKPGSGATFFNPGVVDNIAGTVKPIYCASVGSGSGTTVASLAVIFTCEAKVAGKTSSFSLTNIILGNQVGTAIPFDLSVGQVTVLNSYDLDGNGSVDLSDLLLVASAFGEADDECDFNSDGIVNILDIIVIGQNFTEV